MSETTWAPVLALVLLAVTLAFGLAAVQSFISAKVGSDHPVHAFLARAIRQNGHRLFVRIPKLLNAAYCAALPLYIHWILSLFPLRVMHWAERLLNPSVNALHALLFAVIAAHFAASLGIAPAYAGWATAVFALTPQTYHALSARNFGLSARGTGLLLLTGFFFTAWLLESRAVGAGGWLAIAVLGWLVWSFSTFAQQALCILSALLLLTGRWIPAVGCVLGVLVFLGLHPAYGSAYLRHTLRFIQVYASELAPIYILSRRPSIWRDLVRDIWDKFRTAGRLNGLRYAYENSIVILLFTHPLALVGPLVGLLAHDLPEPISFAAHLSLAGLIAMLCTSFRATRFLGEPERYIEVTTPWAVLAAGYWLHQSMGPAALALIAGLFLIVDIGQIYGSHLLSRHVVAKQMHFDKVEQAVQRCVRGPVRMCSNNEHITKMLMTNDWEFAYCIAVGQPYCGMSVTQAFSTFPQLRREACERLIVEYRLNVCVLDRLLYDEVLTQPPAGLLGQKVCYESPELRVVVFEWQGSA